MGTSVLTHHHLVGYILTTVVWAVYQRHAARLELGSHVHGFNGNLFRTFEVRLERLDTAVLMRQATYLVDYGV